MIKLHGNCIFHMLSKHIAISLLLIFLIFICFSLSAELMVQQRAVDEGIEKYANTYGNKNYYFCGEGFSDVNYYTYLADQNKSIYPKLVYLLTLLRNETKITYVEMFPQGVAIAESNIPEIFLYNYENGDASYSHFSYNDIKYSMAKAIQVSPSYFEIFDVSIASGREFEGEDYVYSEGNTIPVILGSAYTEYFQLGDSFSALYLNKNIQIKVVGFLESGSYFCYSGTPDYIACDRYILMPSLSPVSEEPDNFYKIMLLQQLCGVIVSDIGYPDTYKIYNELLERSNLTGWELYLRDPASTHNINQRIAKYNEMTIEIKTQLQITILFVSLFSLACISIVVCGFVNQNTYEFGVLLLNGAQIKDLVIDIIIVVAILMTCGTLLSLFYLYLFDTQLSQFAFVLSLGLLTTILASILPVFQLSRIKTNEIIGGNE